MVRPIGILAAAGVLLAATVRAPAAGATTPQSYAPAVAKIAPSVVSIFAVKTVANDASDLPGGADGLPKSGDGTHQEENLGSGVIVSPDGYILSNFHVVKDADEIDVMLAESPEKHRARIVGIDPATDLALIKIDATDLTAAVFGDSDRVAVGDVCLAVGDPFGVGQTVTMGIVSATGRSGLGISDYENFIQTDAAINPGNSGGALANDHGDVIGINTAIVSASRGGEGVGFAIPGNLAQKVLKELRRNGRVVRSFLGVVLQPLEPVMVRQFHLPTADGALVGDVASNSPAAVAGVMPGDTIVEFNDKLVADPDHIRLLLTLTKPHTRITLGLMRNGKELRVPVTLAEAPSPLPETATTPRIRKTDLLKGVTVADLDHEARQTLKIPESVNGVLVIGVDVESPAFACGLKPGDVIEEINRHLITDSSQAMRSAKNAADGSLLLRIYDEKTSHFVEISRVGLLDEIPTQPVRE